MMRLRNWMVCSVALCALGSGAVFAQAEAEPAKPKKAPRARKPRPRKPQPVLHGEMARVAKELKLTEDQQKKIAETMKAQQAAVKAWEEANAGKAKDLQGQSKKLRDEMQKLSAERQRVRDAEKAKIAELLTADQKVGWTKYVLRSTAMRNLRGVKLTDDQAAKLGEMLDGPAQKIAAMTDDQRAEALPKTTDELKKAIAEMVTPEQKKQAKIDALASRVLGQFRRAKLTEEQVAKVKALAEAAAADQALAVARVEALNKELNDLRKKIRSGGQNDLVKKAKETILTDEQRAKLTGPPKKPKKPAAPKKEGT